ncbi:histidine kinase [Microbispora sp. H10949]|uniref:sensor histidine kinase n=1 Tax=Microbispora sp. H10949 TaxID=2729111 RepID=UPI002872C966|nr:histidine kinase [Microbispora sp. H10949]
MADADAVAILLPERARDVLRVALRDVGPIEDGPIEDGPGARLADDEVAVQGSLVGRAFLSGEPLALDDLDHDQVRLVWADNPSVGPTAAVPLGAAGTARGALALVKRAGRMPFSRSELRTLHAFAGQAAVALELADTRRDAERLGLLEDRDRIAKDLHDVVIQRLFAVAMTLMSTVRLVERPEASSRLQTAIDELDTTIRQIRSTIFALQTPREDSSPPACGPRSSTWSRAPAGTWVSCPA